MRSTGIAKWRNELTAKSARAAFAGIELNGSVQCIPACRRNKAQNLIRINMYVRMLENNGDAPCRDAILFKLGSGGNQLGRPTVCGDVWRILLAAALKRRMRLALNTSRGRAGKLWRYGSSASAKCCAPRVSCRGNEEQRHQLLRFPGIQSNASNAPNIPGADSVNKNGTASKGMADNAHRNPAQSSRILRRQYRGS